ncbi:uncharacterized protein EV420DRAFT_1617459 [Desarmillaria tabescens]|uniref:Ankyrin n=1 Tax=Armillaria tabescens TaxID=1929756 RepID=A0AA39U2X8_ARMTA|nr:uncharacterized protein EV420DRAFT_1617459 [Desarmillaria tabescens]KAK0465975.1 hypothetical protein EV420DRAFT_1617459 [Desarmillaria tabescens]
MADLNGGASNNERLLAAARTDNEELMMEVFSEGGFDINFQDGLGNTGASRKSVSNGSTDVLEHILSHEDCDVDPINRIEKATPLHLAVKLEHPGLRKHVVNSLLEAGADTKIRDKFGETALDLVPVRRYGNDDDVGSGSGSGSDDD